MESVTLIQSSWFIILTVYWLAISPSLSTRLPSAATPTPASYACLRRLFPMPASSTCCARFYLRPAVLSTAMDSFPQHNPKQAGQAKPTVEEIKEWDADELLEWIQQNEPKQLKGDALEKFKAACISGMVFLMKAGNVEFFENKCNLPIGPSEALAGLARNIAGKKQDTSIGKSTELAPFVVLFTLIHIMATEHTADANTRKRKSPPHTDIAPLPKRTRVGNRSLIVNGKLKHFRSGLDGNFSNLLRREGQAYFDRTRYIFKLHELDNSMLFCRPRRFGKTLTVSMLEHFHGLQYAGEHQSLYKVCNDILNCLERENLLQSL